MPANNYLPGVLETTEAEHLATGFIFTEGPLWHRKAIGNFVDIRQNKLFRLSPGKEPEVVRNTIGGNGTTFDLQGRLIVCEGDDRRPTRTSADGSLRGDFARNRQHIIFIGGAEGIEPLTFALRTRRSRAFQGSSLAGNLGRRAATARLPPRRKSPQLVTAAAYAG